MVPDNAEVRASLRFTYTHKYSLYPHDMAVFGGGDHESVLRNEDLCSLMLYERTECIVHVIILQSTVTYNKTRVVHSLYTVISIKSTFHILTLEWCTVHIRIPDS